MMNRSSILSRFLFLLAFIDVIYGHGRLSVPMPRGGYAGKPNYKEEEPVAEPLNGDFICRGDAAVAPGNYKQVEAGGVVNMQWVLPAAHVGDCFAYLTYDSNKPEKDMMWFKIAEWADCRSMMGEEVPLTIPAYLPSCEHCILRWEWYALHVRPNIEFYAQCVDVKIAGRSDGKLPGPQFKIPGHLPEDGTKYRDGYGTTFFFTGPPLATSDYVFPEDDADAKIPCFSNDDCPSKICKVDNYCLAKRGLSAGSKAALVLAFMFALIAVVGAVFFYFNKSEIIYMKPFKK